MLENDIKCDYYVNRGWRDLKTPFNIFSMFSAIRKENGTVMFIITSPGDNSNDVYNKINDVTNVYAYSRLKQDYINFLLQATF